MKAEHGSPGARPAKKGHKREELSEEMPQNRIDSSQVDHVAVELTGSGGGTLRDERIWMYAEGVGVYMVLILGGQNGNPG